MTYTSYDYQGILNFVHLLEWGAVFSILGLIAGVVNLVLLLLLLQRLAPPRPPVQPPQRSEQFSSLTDD